MTVDVNKSHRHLNWVDLIRTVGAILVVFIHACWSILYLRGQIPDSHWMVGNLYNSIGRIAVPLFFMLTGFLLLGKEEDIFVFFRKRFATLLLPFVFWSVFYIFWYKSYPVGAKLSSVALSIFVSLLKSPPSDHLWYLYALVGLYLLVPAIRVFAARAREKDLLYILLVWFLTGPVLTFVEKIFDFQLAFEFYFLRGYWGYLVLGYWLGKKKVSSKAAYLSLLAGSMMILIIFWLTDKYTLLNEAFDISFYGYRSLTVVLASAFFFVGLKKVGEMLLEDDSFIRKALYSHGQATFGIYMVHVVFLDVLRRGDLGFRLSFRVGDPVYTIPLSALAAYFASYITVMLMKKMPVLKRLVP